MDYFLMQHERTTLKKEKKTNMIRTNCFFKNEFEIQCF